MTGAWLAALLLSAPAAFAQRPAEVTRGQLQVRVKVSGTVVAEDTFRIKSVIAGRIEGVTVATGAWVRPDELLGVLASKEMAAIVDASTRPAKTGSALEERYKKLYKPTEIFCPADCFLLKAFAKPKQWVKPQAVLFEAAKRLRMVGRVRAEDAQWVEDGMALEFWTVKDPSRKFVRRVERYELDVPDAQGFSGGSFSMTMSPRQWFSPGTEWEGLLVPLTKEGVLGVPTSALIQFGGQTYLPVRVSTGLTTEGFTEVVGGVEKGRAYLILEDGQLKGAARHKLAPDLDALDRRRRGPAPELDKPEPKEKPARSKTLPEPDVDYGSDPYQ